MLSEQQREERVNYLGATDAAAVLGLSRWKSPLSVWAEKTGLIKPPDISNELPVKLGNRMEEIVSELFTENTGKKVVRVNNTAYHSEHKFLAANLDRRVVGEKAVLECKTTSAFKAKEWAEDEFPQEYVIQVMHQLAVTGCERGYLAVLIGNQDFKVKIVERDEEALRNLVHREVEFWKKFVEPKVMPETVTAKDRDTLSLLFPTANEGEEILLSDSADAICDSLEGLRADKKSIEAQIEQQENTLRAMIKEAEIGVTRDRRIYWANVTTKRLDTDALKKDRPEVYEAFRKPITCRKFLIKKTKQEETNGENQ